MSMDTNSVDQLKALLGRLGSGEDLASVRDDFVKEFKSVPVKDIMEAEQELIKEGTDPKTVTKLCDLHSGLFHGKTEGEVIREQKRMKKQDLLELPEGHPVDYFIRENSALELILNNLEMALENGGHDDKVKTGLLRLKKIRGLYSKKEELIMPRLERYGITGPSQVMWNVDDQIKAEAGRMVRGIQRSSADDMKEYILALTKRIREMIYKDENILLPIAMQNFSDEEWVDIYRDLFEMGPVFIGSIPEWKHGEQVLKERAEADSAAAEAKNDEDVISAAAAPAASPAASPAAEEAEAKASAMPQSGLSISIPESVLDRGVIHFHGDGGKTPAGELTVAQLKAILSSLPIDVTFIDNEMINRFYKNTDKVFSRPLSTLGQSTYLCHPVPIRAVVKSLTDDFKNGARDEFTRYIPNPDRPVKVTYLAVRDESGRYLGAAEIIEDLTDAFRVFKSMQAAQERDAAMSQGSGMPDGSSAQ